MVEKVKPLLHKASAYNAGDLGSIPGPGRSPGGGNGNPLQHSCLENLMDWQATVHGIAESDTTERLHFHFFTFSVCEHFTFWACGYIYGYFGASRKSLKDTVSYSWFLEDKDQSFLSFVISLRFFPLQLPVGTLCQNFLPSHQVFSCTWSPSTNYFIVSLPPKQLWASLNTGCLFCKIKILSWTKYKFQSGIKYIFH